MRRRYFSRTQFSMMLERTLHPKAEQAVADPRRPHYVASRGTGRRRSLA